MITGIAFVIHDPEHRTSLCQPLLQAAALYFLCWNTYDECCIKIYAVYKLCHTLGQHLGTHVTLLGILHLLGQACF